MGSSAAVKDMPSRYKPPPNERRIPTNFRLPVSLRKKLETVVEFWRARADAEGEAPEAIDAIDMTYVVSTVLGDAMDAELAEFGGMPKDDDALREVVDRIKKRTPKKQ